MTTAALTQILYLLDSAFAGPDWHSVLTNVRSVKPEEWLWVPPGGQRSICSIVQHIGACKYMYQNHAFGDNTFRWEDPLVAGDDQVETIASALAWLGQGQEQWRASIAALDDEELLRPRLAPWGEPKETRWLIATMMQHDLYHAGEINHIRALCRQDEGEYQP